LNDNDGNEITIEPTCVARPIPYLAEPNDPINPKNSSIRIRFGNSMTIPDDYLKQIKIEMSGDDISEYFETPVLENLNTEIFIASKADHILDFTSGSKIVKVTVPELFYYELPDGTKVQMAEDSVLEYKINYETIEKLNLNLKKGSYGDFDTDSVIEKNILESQVVNFSLKENYYFSNWDFYTENIENGEAEPFVIEEDTEYEGSGSAKLLKATVQDSETGLDEIKTILRFIEPSDSDAKILEANRTYRVTIVALNSFDEKIFVKPIAFERPAVSVSPSGVNAVAKNSSISISFNKPMTNMEEMVEKVKIEVDGISVLDSFESPICSETQITFNASTDISKLIDTGGTTKNVTVTVPKDFYYTSDDGVKIYLEEDCVHTYKISSSTNEKGEFNFNSGDSGKTKINLNNLRTYNIGDSFTVRVTSEDPSYQFGGWFISNNDSGTLPEGCLKIERDDENRQVTITVLKQIVNVEVKPVYYKRPMVQSFLPSSTGITSSYKDSSIIIEFASKIDEKYVNQIQITKNGEDIKDCFLSPVVSEEEGKTIITFNADYTNLMKVSGGSEAVVVTIPEDISYTIEGKTPEDKIIVSAGSVQTKTYKVRNETGKKLIVNLLISSGTVNYPAATEVNIGDSIDVSFNTNAGYIFQGWEVQGVSSYVSYDPDQLNKTTITLTAKNEGQISLVGSAVFCPEVSDYEPKYNVNGVECDTRNTIFFNTKMDHSTINKSTVSITNFKTGEDLSKYFTISCRDVNSITVMDMKVDASISDLFKANKLSTYDIRIKLDQDEIKSSEDTGSASLTGTKYDWYYRINSGTETVLPHVSSIHLYKTKKADGTYDGEMSSLKFDNWTEDEYYQNHARKVYLVLEGYDDDSGLSHINYVQRLYKTSIGTESSLEAVTKTAGTKDSFVKVSSVGDHEIYTFETELQFNTSYPDGVVKFDIELVDRAGNATPYEIFYVIKDYGIDGSSVQDSGLLRNNRFAVNGIDTVYCYFDSQQDTFYTGEKENGEKIYYKDDITVKKFEWGYNIDDNMNVIEPQLIAEDYELPFAYTEHISNYDLTVGEDSIYKFDRDENRETYIRLTVEDSVGNVYVKTGAIPEKPVYVGTDEYDGSPLYKSNRDACPIKVTEEMLYYYYQSEYEGQTGWSCNCANPNIYKENGVMTISGESGSDIKYYGMQYDFNGWEIRGTFSTIYDAESVTIEISDEDMPADTQVNCHVVSSTRNAGYVVESVEYPEGFVKNPDLTYLVAYRKEGTGYLYSEGTYLQLQYGESYWICPAVMNNKREFKYGTEVKITVNDDTVPPNMTAIHVSAGQSYYYQTSVNFIKVNLPTDASGMKVESDGLVHLQYWIIANESLSSTFKERQESDIIQYPSKFITYDPDNPPAYLRIPLDDSPENSYTVYVKLVDGSANQNYKFVSFYAYNVLRKYDASFTYEPKCKFYKNYYNIGLYASFRNSEEFDIDWWTEKGYLKYWMNNYPDFSDDEDKENIDPSLSYEERWKLIQYREEVREARIINEYMEDHFESEEKEAYVYHLDNTEGAIINIEAYDTDDSVMDWKQIQSDYTADQCLAMVYTKDGRVQYAHKNGANYQIWEYSTNLFNDAAGKFIRFLALDAGGGGTIANYWKTIYVYPDYYRNKMTCNNKNIMQLKNGLQIFADQPVLVHTYSCSSNLGDDPAQWLNHGFETGIVQKNGTFTYDQSYLKDVEAGQYYVTIAHFIDGTTLMSDPVIKE